MNEIEGSGGLAKDEANSRPLLSQMGPLLFLVWVFLLNFLSRIIFSPLMPTIEKDLGIGHGEAGSLFFLVSLGYCTMLLASGFVSSRLNHRKTITLSAVAMGGALLITSISQHLWAIRLGLIFLGLAAGLYLPSGIATLTGLVNPKDWGKAIAIHEFAPNLGFVIAPFMADMLLRWFHWRGILTGLGVLSLLSGVLFVRFGRGGGGRGEAPKARTLRFIAAEPSFWILMALFSLGIGSSFGLYSMLPLFLVSERGMESTWANTLVGLSRISSVGIPILAGWFTDQFGPRQTLNWVFLAGGIFTILLSVLSGSGMVISLFLQPLIACSFFPPGFTALARISSPDIKNVAVSLTVPVGFLIGAGVVPAGLGVIGERSSFSFGIALLGAFILGGVFLVRFLRFSHD